MSDARRRRRAARRGSGDGGDGYEHARAIQAAVRHLGEHRPERALQMLRRVLDAAPDDPNALHFAGIAHYQCGAYEDAETVLARATEIAPDYAEAQNSLGIVLLEMRRADEARERFAKAVGARPDYANAHTNLGNAARDLGALDAAVEAYQRALSLDPNALQAAYRLAATFITLGRIEEALKACAVALAINPYCQNALAAKAIAAQIAGDTDLASSLYDFARFVAPYDLAVPKGYESKTAFNEALTAAVRRERSLQWEPLNRVTRNGAVTQDMLLRPAPVIKAFERVLRGTIDAHRDALDSDETHPFLARRPARYRLTFIASILRTGGRHPSHIHEDAWISGVYYVAVPPVIGESASAEGAGWLEFGRPDYALANDFEPMCERRQPRAGFALFFPSYYYHGTIPFAGEGERIGIAFDAFPE